ncbi:hypothetical protein BDV28DRAFT_91590 [Aspergillus coremiiformis]|uniref:Uncharacterized protein n=1 Tax=Aspergillus coremiiformis TaxID=138285 RepID=A0A5N6YUV8_9EURO|nr:hypothetical protein BDV28DRAFT_91590 [Aspergillus coremiiformis]
MLAASPISVFGVVAPLQFPRDPCWVLTQHVSCVSSCGDLEDKSRDSDHYYLLLDTKKKNKQKNIKDETPNGGANTLVLLHMAKESVPHPPPWGNQIT